METPKSVRQQSARIRNYTPRLSERKKKLFAKDNDEDCDDELMTGIEPLSAHSHATRNGNRTPKTHKSLEALMGSSGSLPCKKKSPRVISFFETDTDSEEKALNAVNNEFTPTRRSVRLSLKRNSPSSSKSESDCSSSTSPHKENIPVKTTPTTRKESKEDKQLQKMFNSSMQITPRNRNLVVVIDETSSDDEVQKNIASNKTSRDKENRDLSALQQKRQCDKDGSTGLSPMRKHAKLSISPPIDEVSISTKSFYSSKNNNMSRKSFSPTNLSSAFSSSCRSLFGLGTGNSSSNGRNKRRSLGTHTGYNGPSINRGVHHKIRKKSVFGLPPRQTTPLDIDRILSNVRNEKLKKLITAKREEKQQIEKVHNIFRKAVNPIAFARPLSTLNNMDDTNNNNLSEEFEEKYKRPESIISSHLTDTDFSDIECEESEDPNELNNFHDALEEMDKEVIPLIIHAQSDDGLSVKSEGYSPINRKRKFFKSGRSTSTRKEVKILDNIKATVTANGKLSIIPEKKKIRRIKIRSTVVNAFFEEQSTVDAILRNLDDTAFGDIEVPADEETTVAVVTGNGIVSPSNFEDEIDQQLALMNSEDDLMIDDIKLEDNRDYATFRNRLPYNTDDPEIIERQHLLLDFLISNNICTEENFVIFIADPDSHKAEAERIVDQLVMIINKEEQHDQQQQHSKEFKAKVPYNTTDPELIEQQQGFLDFLLSNNICTEENFDIFIRNYEQRKHEADAILAQYVTITTDDMVTTSAQTINENSAIMMDDQQQPVCEELEEFIADPITAVVLDDNSSSSNLPTTSAITSQTIATINTTIEQPEQMKENLTSNISSTNNSSSDSPAIINQTKLYPIFYPGAGNCLPLTQQQSTRRGNKQRSWNGGFGTDQLQIDAGQKQFGAHQCKQCGLVYTIHEPEEEKLHRDFHASLHVLRFKGWIDEDIVAIYPEWGQDGRILRVTETSPPKRRERLMDILKIVDKELGFSSYIIPRTFVAYLAVRKMQIVGLCLVQPLQKANKYLNVNGIDCCTEEQFDAKCGISRIWVSPLHRRFHIAKKLIQAVQLNTIFGEEISLDMIAFSSPTELGRLFAQKITKNNNFLVYQ